VPMGAKTIPAPHMLKVPAQDWQMLAEAQRGLKKLLSLDPQQEEFCDQLSELDPTITLIESRSNSIHQEIDELIDQLPGD
jgi:uncharacterized coiled-coil DUF342 family protein